MRGREGERPGLGQGSGMSLETGEENATNAPLSGSVVAYGWTSRVRVTFRRWMGLESSGVRNGWR
jgi:hypothetical protein